MRLKYYSTLPLARVLVNGESYGEFRARFVTVFVQEEDMLEVAGYLYSRSFDIEVLDVSKEVLVSSTSDHWCVEGGYNLSGPDAPGEQVEPLLLFKKPSSIILPGV